MLYKNSRVPGLRPMDGTSTILFIDHHREDREYWTQRLRMASPDYVVLEAETGKAGLAISRSQRVDCVVTELSLPDMSGFEVLVNLVPRVSHPESAVVMLTNMTLPAMATFALNTGAQAYLIKSRISGDDLDKAIRKAIAVIGPNKNRQP